MKLFIYSLIIALFTISCSTPDQKARTFVDQFNKENKHPILGNRKSIAHFEKDGNITLKIYTNYKGDELEIQLVEKSLPEIIGKQLLNDSKIIELLELGKEFNVYIYDAYNKKIAEESINKNSTFSPIEAKDTNSKAQEFNNIIAILNKNLPITDEAGVTILSINIDNKNLVYTAEIPDELKELFNIEGSSDLLKSELMKDKNLVDAFRQTQMYNIENIIYKYIDKKGNTLKEVKISSTDLYPSSK